MHNKERKTKEDNIQYLPLSTSFHLFKYIITKLCGKFAPPLVFSGLLSAPLPEALLSCF